MRTRSTLALENMMATSWQLEEALLCLLYMTEKHEKAKKDKHNKNMTKNRK